MPRPPWSWLVSGPSAAVWPMPVLLLHRCCLQGLLRACGTKPDLLSFPLRFGAGDRVVGLSSALSSWQGQFSPCLVERDSGSVLAIEAALGGEAGEGKVCGELSPHVAGSWLPLLCEEGGWKPMTKHWPGLLCEVWVMRSPLCSRQLLSCLFSCRVWQLVSAVMFSGVAIMVSEGSAPGHHQLHTAEGVPSVAPRPLAFIPLPASSICFLCRGLCPH